jgi:[histone H3]-lysine36 N-trimethyltransferase
MLGLRGMKYADKAHRDTFIYEYVGEVVNNSSFLKRMRHYAEEGIRHFYFMMLQKDEVSSKLRRKVV